MGRGSGIQSSCQTDMLSVTDLPQAAANQACALHCWQGSVTQADCVQIQGRCSQQPALGMAPVEHKRSPATPGA